MDNFRFRTIGAALCTVAFVSIAASCGDDDTTTTAPADSMTAVGEISFADQWARTSPAMASAGAAYVTIISRTDDKLIAATVPPSVAASAELHQTMGADAATDTTMVMGSDTTMMGGGAMTMRPVEFIELPAGVSVELKPGGFHIMMIGLVEPLEVGTTIQVTLVFETAGEITIEVPVLAEAP